MRAIIKFIGRAIKLVLRLILIGLVSCFLIILGINLFVIGSTQSSFYDLSELQESAYIDESVPILILGAGIINNNEPSTILANRLNKSQEIYQLEEEKSLIVSGDHTDQYYNEVAVMQNYLIEQGVPESKIYLDHAGYSTYESVYRLKNVIEVDRAIIVTQGYHLSRALMIADALGIDAVGVAADDSELGRFEREMREILARVKDFAVVYLDYQDSTPRTDNAFNLDDQAEDTFEKEDNHPPES